MLSVAVDERYAKSIDKLISSSRIYSSRSEFLKDAIRKNLEDMIQLDEDLRGIHQGVEKLHRKMKKRGGPINVSSEERERMAKEFVAKYWG